jgi:hypothetical protein
MIIEQDEELYEIKRDEKTVRSHAEQISQIRNVVEHTDRWVAL